MVKARFSSSAPSWSLLGLSRPSTVILNIAFALSTFCLTFLVAFIAGSAFFSVGESKAESGGSGPTSAEESTISISTNAVNDEIILPIMPTPIGTLVSDELIVTVSTDNPAGYTLKMNSLTDNTDLVNVLDPNQPNNSINPTNPVVPTLPVIASTAAPVGAPAVLGVNTWGYTLDTPLPTTPVFSAIPSFSAPEIIKTTEEPSNNSATTITFAAKANNTLSAGNYTGTIVFTATANFVPPDTACRTGDYECILFTISTTDGTYSIPTSGRVANMNHTYDWDVYVDGILTAACTSGNCTGTGGTTGTAANGIALTSLSSGQHQIEILPHSTPTPGWGNAFGFYTNTTGANAQANKDKVISIDSPLTTMAFSPKTTESTTSAAYMFAHMFNDCTNLTAAAIIVDTYKLPGTITNLSYFLYRTHYNNPELVAPVDFAPLFGWLETNNSITNLANFMAYVHYDNTDLAAPINLASLAGWFNANTSITNLSNFLLQSHIRNTAMKSAIDLTPLAGWFSANTSITDLSNFLGSLHSDSTSLKIPVDLTPLAGWFSANNSITNLIHFLYYIHNGNDELIAPINLSPLAGWFNANTSITNLAGFLSFIHSNNISLAAPIDLTPLAGWFNANNSITDLSNFLYAAHYTNNDLTTPVNLTPLAGWFNANNSITDLSNFLNRIYYNNNKLATLIDLTPFTNWFNANTSITNLSDFLGRSHYSNSNLANPINLTPLTNWFNANNAITDLSYFLYQIHYDNNLANPINLTPLAGWFNNNTSITDLSYFFYGSYHNNTSLPAPTNFTPLNNWFGGGRSFTSLNSFMCQTHYNNHLLSLSGQTLYPNWMKTTTEGGTPIWAVSNAFYRTFYTSAGKNDDTGEPTFQDGTVLSSLSASVGAPNTNRQTFTGRSGITPANTNWK